MTNIQLPPYNKFPEIVSGAILLRQVKTSDIQHLIEISFYNSKPALTLDDAIEMQKKIDLDYQNGTSIHCGIINNQTNKIMSTLGYYRGFNNGAGELGCVLKPEFRVQGYITIAMKLACEFGLKNIGLAKIIAITTMQNHSAIKLLERSNFINTQILNDEDIEFQYQK